VEFFFDQVASSSEPSVEGKVKAIEECLPILRNVRDPLSRDLYIDRLARILAVDPNLVRRSLRSAPAEQQQRRPQAQAAAPAPQEKAPEEPKPRAIPPICYTLLALLAHKPELMSKLSDEHLARLPDPAVRALLEGARSQGAFVARVVLESATADIRDAVAKALVSEELAGEIDGEAVLRAITTELTLPTDRRALEDARADAIKRGERWLVEIITKRIVSSTRIQGETPR
jgi:DNA primase